MNLSYALTYFLSTCLYLQIGTEIREIEKNILKRQTQKKTIFLDDIGWYEIIFCLVKNNKSKTFEVFPKAAGQIFRSDILLFGKQLVSTEYFETKRYC